MLYIGSYPLAIRTENRPLPASLDSSTSMVVLMTLRRLSLMESEAVDVKDEMPIL